MILTDSHCHLGSHKFQVDELESILSNASDLGVKRMVTLATSLEDIPENIALSDRFENVYSALGIHPCDVHQTPDSYLEQLREYAQHPKCVAIGETGLDYFHPAPEGWTDSDYHARQRELLHQHFQLAAEVGKNIVIHTRDRSGKASLEDAIKIYADYADTVTAVFHCFLGPWEYAAPIMELGGYVSFTGIVTFKKATGTLDAAVRAPADRIMVETDAPYLAPVPHRGKRNEPGYTFHTAEHIANSRGISLEEFAALTEENVNRFFKI